MPTHTITVDKQVAVAMRQASLTGDLAGPKQIDANGNVTFPVDDEVWEAIQRARRSNESDGDVVRRLLLENGFQPAPPPKPM
jgi:hypothetical protein